MNELDILDNEEKEIEVKQPYWFQLVETFLVGGLISLLFFYGTKLNLVPVNMAYIGIAVSIFSLTRIYLEYKLDLITGFGIILKLILFLNLALILLGVLFMVFRWDYMSEMTILALLSVGLPYLIYACCLNKISLRVRSVLIANALSTLVLALGLIFRIERWTYDSMLLIVGYIVVSLSTSILIFLSRKDISKKEKYHLLSYVGRSIGLLVFVSLYL